jgi:hypothetical protein
MVGKFFMIINRLYENRLNFAERNKMIPKLIKEFRQNVESNAKKLTKSMKLEDFPPGDVKDAIQFGYEHGTTLELALAVLMNAVVSSQKKEFLLSRKLFLIYCKQDPNLIEPKSINSETMRKIAGMITETGFCKRITEASIGAATRRKAATYVVSHPDVLSLIGKPLIDYTRTFNVSGMPLNGNSLINPPTKK